MKYLEGTPSLTVVQQQWAEAHGLQSLLFALYTELVSIHTALAGHTSSSNTSKHIKETIARQEQATMFIQSLYSMTTTKSVQYSTIHPEQLFEKLALYAFTTTHTYETTLVSTDLSIFLECVSNLLGVITQYKKFVLAYRKRGDYVVIRMSHGQDVTHIDTASFINAFSLNHTTIKTLNLKQHVLLYTLCILKTLEISIKIKSFRNKLALYIYVPSARQLKVFDKVQS